MMISAFVDAVMDAVRRMPRYQNVTLRDVVVMSMATVWRNREIEIDVTVRVCGGDPIVVTIPAGE